MYNDHINCNCYDCQPYSGNHVEETILGKFVHSSKSVNVYNEPGGNPRKAVKSGGFIGAVEGLNTKKNWIKLTNGLGWIPYTKDLTFKKPDPNAAPLTGAQKLDVILNVAKAMPVPGGNVVKIGSDVKDAGESVIDFMSHWKLILIGVIVLIVLLAYLKFK